MGEENQRIEPRETGMEGNKENKGKHAWVRKGKRTEERVHERGLLDSMN